MCGCLSSLECLCDGLEIVVIFRKRINFESIVLVSVFVMLGILWIKSQKNKNKGAKSQICSYRELSFTLPFSLVIFVARSIF